MDIAITWPKTRALSSYISQLREAKLKNLQINYRVPSRPTEILVGGKSYMVYDGAVRGWIPITAVSYRDDVMDVFSGQPWQPGWFIVRSPEWHQIDAVPMAGFRGYRYVREGIS